MTIDRCLIFVIMTAISLFSPLALSEASAEFNPDLLKTLVEINSHSANIEGLEKMRTVLIPEFESLGFTAHRHPLENQHQTVSFDFPNEKPSLLLIGHIDTVFKKDSEFQKFRIEGSKLIGPGIIDMKGGIAVLLEILTQIPLDNRKKIRVILNDDEELASIYSKSLIKALGQGIPYGLVFEPGLPDGSLVTSSVGGGWIKISVKGKAAHAGLEHQKGLNACAEVAHQTVLLNRLTDYSKKVTVNIGVLSGGTQGNVVCENASVIVEYRFVEPTDRDRVLKRIHRITSTPTLRNSLLNLTPQSRIQVLADIPSMPEASTRNLFARAKKLEKVLGSAVHGAHVGYATDGNTLAQIGTSLLVGLGPYGGGMHTDLEFMEKDSFHQRVKLGGLLIREILSTQESSQ